MRIEPKERVEQQHELIFQRSNGERKHIAFVEGEPKNVRPEIIRLINEFCEERNFQIHYIRTWSENGETWYDVGSWSEFFIVRPELPWEVA